MAKKKSKGYAWLIVVFIAIAAFIAASQLLSIQTPEEIQSISGGYINVQTYGWLKCEESDTIVSSPVDYKDMTGKTQSITCQGWTGQTLLQQCDVLFKMPTEDELNDQFGGILSVTNAVAFTYRICDSGETCPEKGTTIYLRKTKDNKEENLGKIIREDISMNQYIEFKVEQEKVGVAVSEVTDDVIGAKLEFKPFFVYRYDVFSKATGTAISEADCVFKGEPNEANFIIESVKGGGDLSDDLPTTDKADLETIRSRGAVKPYLSNFVAVVPQFDLFEEEGETRYCYDKRIYQVEEIETPSGIYKVANTQTNAEIRKVDCCNDGDVPTGYTCEDFELVQLSETEGRECNALNPCPIVGFAAKAGKEVVYQECVEGQCETKFLDVNCNFDEECQGGYCEVDATNPENNECVQIDPTYYCGNGICEDSRGEDVDTCPKDCTISKTRIDPTIIFIVLGIVVVAIVMLIIKQKQSKGKKFSW